MQYAKAMVLSMLGHSMCSHNKKIFGFDLGSLGPIRTRTFFLCTLKLFVFSQALWRWKCSAGRIGKHCLVYHICVETYLKSLEMTSVPTCLLVSLVRTKGAEDDVILDFAFANHTWRSRYRSGISFSNDLLCVRNLFVCSWTKMSTRTSGHSFICAKLFGNQ